ncbi:MAG: hypothetical protein HY078_09305 [Elusimicrobia bacterium]|nr:hypothetical protein [Elusimicrobiota bacterium]
MRNPLLALPLLAAFAVLPAAAADTNDAAVDITLACRKDLRTLCKPKPGGPGPLACLMEHKAEVAPECRKALDASKGAALPAGKTPGSAKASSCTAEFAKSCKGARGEAMRACLKAHRGDFSELCRQLADAAAKVPPKK